MARIRSIKPGLFRNVDLYQAESEANKNRNGPYLNIRFAFAGLFTAADRDGRFKWQPQELKLDCLPHDPIDFSEVLEVLRFSGTPPFLLKYEVNGRAYGLILGFPIHQRPHHTESKSIIPGPPSNGQKSTITATPEETTANQSPKTYPTKKEIEACFKEFWDASPNKDGPVVAKDVWMLLRPPRPLFERIMAAIEVQKKSEKWTRENGRFIPRPGRWLEEGCWDNQPVEIAGKKPLLQDKPKSWTCDWCGSSTNLKSKSWGGRICVSCDRDNDKPL